MSEIQLQSLSLASFTASHTDGTIGENENGPSNFQCDWSFRVLRSIGFRHQYSLRRYPELSCRKTRMVAFSLRVRRTSHSKHRRRCTCEPCEGPIVWVADQFDDCRIFHVRLADTDGNLGNRNACIRTEASASCCEVRRFTASPIENPGQIPETGGN